MYSAARRIAALWHRVRPAAAPPTPARTAPAPPPHQLVRRVRRLLNAEEVTEAQSVVDLRLADPGASDDAHLAAGLVAHRRRFYALALHHFDLAGPQAAWITPLPNLESMFHVDPERALELVRSWTADPDARVRARTWHLALRYLFAHGDDDLRHTVHDRLVAAYQGDDAERWPEGAAEITWLDRWRGARRGAVGEPVPGRISFAVMDYVQPGKAKTSQNIGDHVQTLASLGHLVRRTAATFHGDEDLAGFVTELQDRVRPELRLDGPATDVQLHRMDRDASTFQSFPAGTWLLEFGWHMHDLAGTGTWDLPLHPALRPIFVSFHCSKRGLLTGDVLAYLRRHGPVGCRDWTTVDLLLSLDVPAFFSGCLTTTVSTVFPEPAEPAGRVVYVDAVRDPVPEGATRVRQSYRRVKHRSFVENLREAVRLLEWYRTDFTGVVTKRLHCYLPATSLGLRVDFRPANNADVRFNGLFRLAPDEFESIRTSMLARLEPVLTAILTGAAEDDVYALWRETVAPEVELARARHAAPATPAPLARTPDSLAAPVATSPDDGEADGVDVVFLPATADLPRLASAVAGVDRATAGPLRVWIVGSGLADTPLPPVSATTRVRLVDTTALDLDPIGVDAEQRPHSVLLGHLLPDVSRAVVLPVDATVLADVAELAATDLGGHVVAARTTSGPDPSGFGVLYRAARRLDDTPETAFELYRFIHGRHVFDFDAFDTGVLVLDLDRARSSGLAATALPLMRDFRLTAREALHLCTGPHRAAIDAAWDHVPTRDVPVAAPKLVHWVDRTKPWDDRFVALQDLWVDVSAARDGAVSASLVPGHRPR